MEKKTNIGFFIRRISSNRISLWTQKLNWKTNDKWQMEEYSFYFCWTTNIEWSMKKKSTINMGVWYVWCVSSDFGKSCVCVGANYTYHCSNHDELINILLMKKKLAKNMQDHTPPATTTTTPVISINTN